MLRKELVKYVFIAIGSFLYAVGTLCFIFPNSLLLGGTSGISVILDRYVTFLSSGNLLVIINVLLLVLAFFTLGRDMATKTFAGSLLTTLFVGLLEPLLTFDQPLIADPFLSAAAGASVIAVASGILFFVDSSSGGTDIIALIVKKYSSLNIGKALLVTDVLIVVVGGLLSGWRILLSSFLGFLIKTLGIDAVIWGIRKWLDRRAGRSA